MILKLKSLLITKIFHDIKVALIYKIRNFYSKKLYDKLFILASKIDSKLNKNNLEITIESNNLDKFTEESKELNQKISCFISKELRSRAINGYIKKGILFSGKRLAKNYSLEKIIFHESDIVIDCGANFGGLWIYLNLLNIPIKYICVEPGSFEFRGISKTINYQRNSKIHSYLINKALSSQNGKTNFFYSEEADSSLIEYKGYSKKYVVETITLDSLIKELALQNKKLKLLKLEAEGTEPEVIKGGMDVIKNIEYIAADLGPERGFNQEITLKEVANILLQNNFEIIDIVYPRLCVLFKNKNLLL